MKDDVGSWFKFRELFFKERRWGHKRDWIAGDSFHARGKHDVGPVGVREQITGFALHSGNSSLCDRAETQECRGDMQEKGR